MDNQWQQHHHQYHQAVQGNNNICPMCSNFHYPFCPPHPSMNQNPRFLPPQDLPFRGHTHVPEPYRLPMDPYRHPVNGYKDPMLLHDTNYHPSLDRHSHGYGSYNGNVTLPYDYSNSGGKDFDSGGDRNVKRMRVGETDLGAGVNDFRVNSSMVMLEEDERRLSLIRNHGCAGTLSVSSPNGANMMPGTIAGFNRENGFVEQGCFNGYWEDRGGDAFNMPVIVGMSDHQDPGFQSGERGVPSHPNSVLRSHDYREGHSLSYGHQYMQSNRHPRNMVRDAADKGKRYDMPSLQGMSNNNPQIPQQGPQVFPERNGFKSSSPYNEQRTTIPMNNLAYNDQPLGSYQLQNSMHNEYDFQSPSILNDIRPSFQVKFPSLKDNHLPYNNNNNQGNYMPMISAQPPLPPSPPPPLPVDPPYDTSFELKAAYKPHSTQPYLQNKSHFSVSTGVVPESQHYLGEGQLFPVQPRPADKVKAIDASHLLIHPHRATRPGHIVIILRGLPGSGKSYLAKMFRDLEVENGGGTPRIHSIDDYFMTENEKVDESELEKSTGSGRAKKKTMKKVMEYCYEPEMEEAYRSSMLKAFKKTLDEGVFTFVIVDDRNLRVADFAQFWAIAKRSGYEAYLLEAAYKDPAGCAARNVHGFTQDDIQKMAKLWEKAPSWYLQVDVKSLLHGDDLKDGDIQEVDMDTEDRDLDETPSGPQAEKLDNAEVSAIGDRATGSLQDKDGPDGAEGNHPREQIKELGKSKWSADFDEDVADRIQGPQRRKNSLSGLIEAYAKDGKSVQWSDQGGNTGFTIGAAKKANVLSLVIGPGAGYNLKSNPLPEVNPASTPNTGEKHSIFQQQLRAERESFKAIFDRRGHRIALDYEEE